MINFLNPQRFVSVATSLALAGSGTITVSGSGTMSVAGDVALTGSGTIALGGIGTISTTENLALTGSGTITLGGTGTLSTTDNVALAGSGTIALGGTGTISTTENLALTGSGTIALGGTGTISTTDNVALSGSGTIALGGIGTLSTTDNLALTGSGTIALGGTGTISTIENVALTGSGTIALGGTGTLSTTENLALTGSGTIALGGTGTVSVVENVALSGSGTIALGGTGTATVVTPVFNNSSASFDGSDDHIDADGFNASTVIGTGDYTASLWVNLDTVAQNKTFLYLGKNDASSDYISLRTKNVSGYKFQILGLVSGSAVCTGTTTVTSGTWFHLAYTRSGTTVKLYVNGSLETTATNAAFGAGFGTSSNTDTLIGCFRGNVINIDGKVDEVAVWDSVLTASEITKVYNSGEPFDLTSNDGNYTSSTDLQGYWRFEDNTVSGSNGTIADSSGNSRTATTKNGVTFSTDIPVPHTNNYSISLDGEDTYLSIGNPSDLQITGNMTISAWFKTSSGSNNRIIDKDGGGGQPRSYILLLVSNKLRWVRFNASGTGYTIDTVDTFNDNAWHHVVVTNKTSGTIDIYVDGTALTLGTGTGNYTNVTSSGNSGITMNNAAVGINMGYFAATTSQYFDGLIDEVAIWDDVLTASEVTAIYNNGAPTDLTTDAGNYASSANLQGHWRMEEGSGTSVADSSSNSNAATLNNSPTFSSDTPS